jgi:flagellin
MPQEKVKEHMININATAAATAANYSINKANVNLQKSLIRLSSGLRNNSSTEEDGGLALSTKLSAAIRRTDATAAHVGDSLSFLQTQDGVLATFDGVVGRMAELAALASDPTKAGPDLALYEEEFTALESELTSMLGEAFNGISLFNAGAQLTVRTSENGDETVAITQLDLQGIEAAITGTPGVGTNADATITSAELDIQIQALAELRATNGAEQDLLTFAQDMLAVNRKNLEAAHSQIMDVQLAEKSTKYATRAILQNGDAALLAQVNSSSARILSLLDR